MKRIILTIVGLALALPVLAQQQQVENRSQSFINNGTYVALSNNFTLSWGTTNGLYYGSPGSNITYVPYNVGTNVVGGTYTVTNASGNSTLYPGILSDVNVTPNPDGSVPLAAITMTWNIATNYALRTANPGTNGVAIPWIDSIGAMRTWPIVNGYTNADGSTGVPHSLINPTVGNTNEITLTFVRSLDGVNFSTIDGLFSWQVSNSAVNIVSGQGITMITNLPSSFLQGTKKIRLLKVVTDNKASAVGVTIDDIRYSQTQH